MKIIETITICPKEPSYGQIGFDKYGDEGRPEPWKTFDGRDMPRWSSDLPHMADTRRRWDAAAEAVIDAYLARNGLPPRKTAADLVGRVLDRIEEGLPQ